MRRRVGVGRHPSPTRSFAESRSPTDARPSRSRKSGSLRSGHWAPRRTGCAVAHQRPERGASAPTECAPKSAHPLLDGFLRLLPASNAGGHDEHVLIAKLDRRTGGLMTGQSLLAGAVEDELRLLVAGQIGGLHALEIDPLRSR